MPLKTFYNLSYDKQEKIINTCFSEFSSNDFESASLGRIIKEIGVAKGSFYRYFQDKNDVYDYLFEISRSEIISSFEGAFSDQSKSFYDCWKDYISLIFELEKKYPDLLRFQLKASYNNSSGFKKSNGESKFNQKLDIFCNLLKRYQEKGEIREDVPLEMLALVMSYSQYGIFNYFMMKNKSVKDMTEKTFLEEISNFMKIMEGGFKK